MADEEEQMAVEDIELEDEDMVEEEDSDEDEGIVVAGDDADETANGDGAKVFIPGVTGTAVAPQDLEFDQSAYDVYHEAQSGYPCLSFDVIKESYDVTSTFPVSLSFVAGTQAEKTKTNQLMVIRMSNLHKIKKKSDDDDDEDDEVSSDDDEDDDMDKKPVMQSISVDVSASVNRIRQTKINEKTFVASWLENGVVQIHDISEILLQLRTTGGHTKREQKAQKQFRGHKTEGFALDWSPTVAGRFLSGDCDKDIHLWEPATHSGGWNVDQRPFKGHLSSVEDLQWSPSEKSVFASCSSDKTIRIWDTRARPDKANMLTARDAHEADVNVINWNKNDPFLVSGGDDGVLKVWDLRQFKDKKTLATFKQHTGPITSVEWHPSDSSIFAASGADNQITLWDLGVEKDSGTDTSKDDPQVPPQLLFIHLGQNDIKELHWHSTIPGLVLSTAESGFNVFKTISV